jgi:hypothetical protein
MFSEIMGSVFFVCRAWFARSMWAVAQIKFWPLFVRKQELHQRWKHFSPYVLRIFQISALANCLQIQQVYLLTFF